MIETNIGQVALTPNQLSRLSTLHNSNIHGFYITPTITASEAPVIQFVVLKGVTA